MVREADLVVEAFLPTSGPTTASYLIQTLLKHDLIDEFRLWVFPLVLGIGKRLFDGGTIPASLKLVDSKTSSTGVIITRFERGGEIGYGSFALEEPTGAEVERRDKLAAR